MNSFYDYLKAEIFKKNKKVSFLRVIIILFFGSGNPRAVLLYRIGKKLHDLNYRRVSRLFFNKLERDYGVYISPNASIGIGFKMPHPTSIVIGDGVILQKNVTIYQQVTIGGVRKGDAQNGMYPEISEGCIVFAGAKVLGKIKIGCNVVVGANAVVIRNVPENCTAIGIPAKNTPRVIEDSQ